MPCFARRRARRLVLHVLPVAVPAKIGGFFRLIPEEAFPVGTVRIVTADAGHGPAGTPWVVLFIDRMAGLPALRLYPDVAGKGGVRVLAVELAAVALPAHLIAFGFRESLVR